MTELTTMSIVDCTPRYFETNGWFGSELKGVPLLLHLLLFLEEGWAAIDQLFELKGESTKNWAILEDWNFLRKLKLFLLQGKRNPNY